MPHTMPIKSAIAALALVFCCSSFEISAAQDNSTGASSPDESFEQAALDYITWCGPCHGRSAKGDGPVASSLVSRPIDLTKLAQSSGGKFPADIIRESIDGRDKPSAHGTREMPVWGYWFKLEAQAGGLLQEDNQSAEKEVADRIGRLVDYLETLQE